jgi:hypothetical protein
MVIDMNETKLTTLEQVRAFLAGTAEVGFCATGAGEDERYRHIAGVLARFGYKRLKKPDKGLILRYLERTTSYSRQQLTRLVGRWCEGRVLRKNYRVPKHGWVRKFTDLDVALLAETDALHNTLSGPATVHLMRRALERYGDARYARLATISVGHLYNLRKERGYLARRQVFAKTRPTGIAIGVRRVPTPDGRPGFIRIDSVHQCDQDGAKGVYHIMGVARYPLGQRRRLRHPVGAGRHLREDIGGLSATCHRSPAGGLPVPHPWISCRQRIGIHQPQGRQNARQARGGIHQITPAPFQRQRPGGDQKRSDHQEALGLQPYSAALCRRDQCVLRRASESLHQSPPPLPVRRGISRQEGQNPQALSA